MCSIDPMCERPELRSFEGNLIADIKRKARRTGRSRIDGPCGLACGGGMRRWTDAHRVSTARVARIVRDLVAPGALSAGLARPARSSGEDGRDPRCRSEARRNFKRS